MDADALIESDRFRVKCEVGVDFAPLSVLPGHGLGGVVLAVVDVQDVGNAARIAVDHFDQRLLQRLRVGVDARHVADDSAGAHIQPRDQLRAHGLDLAVRSRPLYPKVEGVLVADDILHDLKARRVALALHHPLVLPLPRPVGCKEPGGLCAPLSHEELDVPGHRLDGGVLLPLPPLCLQLEPLIEHLDRAEVRREPLVEPDVLNNCLLLVRQARERPRLLRLPAQRQRPEVVPALAVLLLQLQRPCVRFQHILHVAVQALRADPQPQRVPLGVARAVRAVIVDEVLHPCRQLYRLIEALLVRLRVLVQVGGDIPRHGLLCSLVYDDLTPFHLLRGSPCLPRLCREGTRGD